MNLILAIQEQTAKAKEGAALGVVTHMNAGMASCIVNQLDTCEDEERIKMIQVLDSHSSFVHEDNKNPWIVTFKR